MDDTTQPIGPPPRPFPPGAPPAAPGTPQHAHGSSLPEVAAATGEQRAAAEALWKDSMASAGRWRDPEAAAAGFRFKDDGDGPGRKVRFVHVPNPAWRAPTVRSSTRPARRRSSTGTALRAA